MAKWELMAGSGADGTILNYRGVHSSATTYYKDDMVTHLGSSYISKTTNTNKDPATEISDWGLLSAKGDAGPASFTMYVQQTAPTGTIPNGSLWVKV
jgi:hypothetical protein